MFDRLIPPVPKIPGLWSSSAENTSTTSEKATAILLSLDILNRGADNAEAFVLAAYPDLDEPAAEISTTPNAHYVPSEILNSTVDAKVTFRLPENFADDPVSLAQAAVLDALNNPARGKQ